LAPLLYNRVRLQYTLKCIGRGPIRPQLMGKSMNCAHKSLYRTPKKMSWKASSPLNVVVNMTPTVNLPQFADKSAIIVKCPKEQQSVAFKFARLVCRNSWIFPLIAALLVPFLCISMYIAAVLYYKEVEPIFPYVSDIGTNSPQAGYFSQVIDLAAFAGIIAGFFRYRQINYYLESVQKETKVANSNTQILLVNRLKRSNFISVIIFMMAIGGLISVGNFRSSEILFNHLMAAAIAFGGIAIYSVIMTRICSALWRQYQIESRPTSMFATSAIGITALIIMPILGQLSTEAGFSNVLNAQFRQHWRPEQKGYLWHALSAAAEWILINSITPFLLCISRRMYHFQHWDCVFQ